MSTDKKGMPTKSIIMHIIGGVVLLLGIVFILKWWVYLVVVFRGIIGLILALLGMGILYMARQ